MLKLLYLNNPKNMKISSSIGEVLLSDIEVDNIKVSSSEQIKFINNKLQKQLLTKYFHFKITNTLHTRNPQYKKHIYFLSLN